MESDEERRKRLMEAWRSIKAIYLMGAIGGYVRIKAEHWFILERICNEWEQQQRMDKA